jgi:hypothetical protein
MSYFSAAVYVEGDIETRVYNDRINNQVKNIPEICVRRDGMLILGLSAFFPCIAVETDSISTNKLTNTLVEHQAAELVVEDFPAIIFLLQYPQLCQMWISQNPSPTYRE